MDHVVYLDSKAKEMELLLSGEKSMIIRGATGRKMPYGRVNENDTLYLINNNAEGEVKAQAIAKSVYNSEKMSEDESKRLVADNQNALRLTSEQIKKWAGKRYLVLIGVERIEKIEPFKIDKSNYSNMDDWLPVADISTVKIS
jgi:hypothetical protein